ncbi:MAG: GatB/YqeY domain-containing protein [Verrucomicrobiota bacterium]
MSNLAQQIVTDIKDAMKAKDKAALTVLRSLKAEIQKETIAKYGADGELDENESLAVVRRAIKQRNDSVASFKDAGRDELAETEAAEIKVLEKYLPAQLDEDELGKIVDDVIAEVGATSKKEMGQVMKALQEKVAGRADNKSISQAVMQRLS